MPTSFVEGVFAVAVVSAALVMTSLDGDETAHNMASREKLSPQSPALVAGH